MARGHVGIVVGVQSGFTALCDIWGKASEISAANSLEAGRLHQAECEIVENIKRLINIKRLCEQCGIATSIALPNSDQLTMLNHFFQFVGEPLKNKEAVRLEAIQNLPIKTFLYIPMDVTPSRFVEQIARLTLLCPKIDHVVLSKEPKWNHSSLLALKESWNWIDTQNSEQWNGFLKDCTGRGLEDLAAESVKDPLTITRSPKMKKLLEVIDRVSESDKPLVISGEEGVGKELVLKRSKREAVDFAGVVPMLEELLAKGPGALLVGSFESMSEDDQDKVASYSVAGVVTIDVPALRFRKEDLELLIDFFIQKFNIEKKKKISGLSRRALRALAAYDWPGNVRELEALIERSVILKASGIIDVCDIPEKFVTKTLSEIEYEDIIKGANKRLAPQGTSARKDACYDQKQGEDFKMSNNSFFKGHIEQMAAGHTCDTNCQHEQSSFGHKEGVSSMQKIEEFLDVLQSGFKCTDEGVDFNTIVDRFENILILAALARTGWNRNRAAALLKLNRTTLVEKLKKKQLAQPGGVNPTVAGPTAPINF
jgi:transcriptional regulator with GAF, ATPase, and Fis domain